MAHDVTHTPRHTPHTHILSLTVSHTGTLSSLSPFVSWCRRPWSTRFCKEIDSYGLPKRRAPWRAAAVGAVGAYSWDLGLFYLSVVASLQWRVDGVASRALTSPPSISLTHGTACTTAVGRASAVGQTDRGDSPEKRRRKQVTQPHPLTTEPHLLVVLQDKTFGMKNKKGKKVSFSGILSLGVLWMVGVIAGENERGSRVLTHPPSRSIAGPIHPVNVCSRC